MSEERIDPGLSGVPETMLWTLWHRVLEARRPDAVLVDPLAVELIDRIDYPFAERFGESFGQFQAVRTKCFDREVRRFLRRHPAGTVVALGEGLETQFWRVDNGSVRWVGVDLPEVEDLRHRLQPAVDRVSSRAESVTDLGWLEELARGPTLVTAQGLLMYLRPEDVDAIVRGIAEALPEGGDFVFDAMAPWAVERSRSGKLSRQGYTPPPWDWGLDDAEARWLAGLSPRIVEVRALQIPRGRGFLFGFLMPLLGGPRKLRRRTLSVNRPDDLNLPGPATYPLAKGPRRAGDREEGQWARWESGAEAGPTGAWTGAIRAGCSPLPSSPPSCSSSCRAPPGPRFYTRRSQGRRPRPRAGSN
jgi:O-methyltransferase involved in polyketide biosynthesis